MTPGERMRQSATVDIFEFTAHRHPMRDARGADSVLVRQIADVLGCGFPFHRGTGGQNDFLQLANLETRFELVEAQLLRADTVQRRQMPQQHEITPAEISSLFQHFDVHRCLHNAQRRGIACLVLDYDARRGIDDPESRLF